MKSDIIIIGAGPGGYKAAELAAKAGKTVTIFEASKVGGTCLNEGCIPTKAFVRNAEIIQNLNNADRFGIRDLAYELDFQQVVSRKNEVIATLRQGVETLLTHPNITLIREKAQLKDTSTVFAGGKEYTASDIIVATGSIPKSLKLDTTVDAKVLDSSDLLNIDHLPHSLCIIGAGVIGMEFASVFNAFGVEVTVIEFLKECLLAIDSDIAKRLRKTLEKKGVTFHLQSAVKAISADGITFQDKKGEIKTVQTENVLMAVGRQPRTEGIGLENINVKLVNGAIPTGEQSFQIIDAEGNTCPNLFAIGDVNGRTMLAHAAEMQAQHVINHIIDRKDDIRFDVMPAAIFTLPEVAAVGLSEDQCKLQGIDYLCKKAFWRSNGKALAMDEAEGMLKLLAKTDGTIIGCHAFGSHAAYIIQEATTLICRKTSIAQLADITHIHPTLSEILHDAAI